MLERWLLKHIINLEVIENFSLRPTREMVNIVFGYGDFDPRAGIYLAHSVGESVARQKGELDYFRQVDPLDGQLKITGGLFMLRGIYFFSLTTRPSR